MIKLPRFLTFKKSLVDFMIHEEGKIVQKFRNEHRRRIREKCMGTDVMFIYLRRLESLDDVFALLRGAVLTNICLNNSMYTYNPDISPNELGI